MKRVTKLMISVGVVALMSVMVVIGDGVVYDVSDYFTNGSHHGAEAGVDQSAAFHNEPSESQLALERGGGVVKESVAVSEGSTSFVPAVSKHSVHNSGATPVATSSTHDLTVAQQNTVDALIVELGKLEQQDDQLDSQETGLKRAYHDGKLTTDAYRKQMADLKKKDNELERREDEIERELQILGVDDHDAHDQGDEHDEYDDD